MDENEIKTYDYSLLPPHVLTKILSFLDFTDFKSSVQTCTSWYYSSCDPKIVKRLRQQIPFGTHSIEHLVRPFSMLHIHQANLNAFNYRELFKKFGYHIDELWFASTIIRLTQLLEIMIYLPNLRILNITDNGRSFRINNVENYKPVVKHKQQIVKNLRNIKMLSIQTYEKRTQGIELLLNYCPNLETFIYNKDWYGKTNNDFILDYLIDSNRNRTICNLKHFWIECIDKEKCAKFFEKFANLDHLNLQVLCINEISLTYYDYNFKEFCKNLRKLEYFKIRSCNDQQLTDICKYMRKLKSIELEDTNITKLKQIGNLKQLEILQIDRIDTFPGDEMSELLDQKFSNLRSLRLNQLSLENLVQICENYRNLENLQINELQTKDCQIVFKNLVKLKSLTLNFHEPPTCNSKKIINSGEFNITNLCELEELAISCFVPGITLDLIEKLPKLKSNHHHYIYDPEDSVNEPDNDRSTAIDNQGNVIMNATIDDYEFIENEDDVDYNDIENVDWYLTLICDN